MQSGITGAYGLAIERQTLLLHRGRHCGWHCGWQSEQHCEQQMPLLHRDQFFWNFPRVEILKELRGFFSNGLSRRLMAWAVISLPTTLLEACLDIKLRVRKKSIVEDCRYLHNMRVNGPAIDRSESF